MGSAIETRVEDQEVLCSIDWLGLSVRIVDDPKPISGYVWKEYTATNVWSKRRILWTEHGDRVLTLLTDPRSSLIDHHAGLVEIENEWLYHGGGFDAILSTLLKSVMFEITGISRLDLCADFVPNDSQRDIILGLAENRYYVGGKRSGSSFWSTNTCTMLNPIWLGKRIPHCQSWGHKSSAIKWKLYYKTRELYEAGGWKFAHKPYIMDVWRLNGLDTSNVWRLEVSCKHLNNYNMYGQCIDLQTLRQFRGNIFVSLYDGRFTIRKEEGHKDRTNDTIVPFLPVFKEGRTFTGAETKRLAEHHGRITLLRHLVSSLDDEHVYLDEESRYTVFDAIQKIVQRDGLDNYFRAMTGKWLDDFFTEVDNKAQDEFSLRMAGSNVLYMEERGSSGPVGRYDIHRTHENSQFAPNGAFEDGQMEDYLKTDSEALKEEKRQFEEKMEALVRSSRRPTPPEQQKLDLLP